MPRGSPRSARRRRRAHARSCRTATAVPCPPTRRPHRLTHGLARLLGDAQHGGHRVGHRRRIGDRCQFENPNPVGELIDQSRPRLLMPGGSCRPHLRRSSVTNRCVLSAASTSATSDSRPMKLVSAGRRFPGVVSSARNGGKSVRRPGACTWNTPTGLGTSRSRRGPRSQQIDSAEQNRRRLGHQDLTAVPGGHHPRRAVEHRPEVVPVAQLGLTGRDAHPHRQLQRPLRSDRSIDSRPRRRERGNHAVTGVAEQKPVVRLDRGAQHLVMRQKGRPHRIRVGLPPTGRTLNIGEQKRHHPRRSSRPISGHPRRISQQTRAYLAHRRIRPGHRIHVFS